MTVLSNRAKSLKPSPTLAINAKAKSMQAQGIHVISFGAGEPDFDTPENIKQAAKKALDEGFLLYQSRSRDRPTRERRSLYSHSDYNKEGMLSLRRIGSRAL